MSTSTIPQCQPPIVMREPLVDVIFGDVLWPVCSRCGSRRTFGYDVEEGTFLLVFRGVLRFNLDDDITVARLRNSAAMAH